jgi:hypothetical protein
MPEPDLFQIFVSRLTEAGIPYIITGAVASAIYGEPRLTHDIDLVVELADESLDRMVGAFPMEEFYCPPVEVIKLESKRPYRGHFNLIHHKTGFKADIYTVGQDGLHRWAMAKRRKIRVEDKSFWVAPPEYVILRKLEYYREGQSEKHLRDVAGMLEVSGADLDLKELHQKIKEYHLEQEWQKAQELTG